MNTCALSDTKQPTCFNQEHIELISQYVPNAKTLQDIQQSTGCEDDICILNSINLNQSEKDKIILETQKPSTISYDHNHWLNNTEIDNVMTQFRCKFPGFGHGFIHMIDLKQFDPANVKKFDYQVYQVDEVDMPKEIKNGLIQRGLLKGSMEEFKSKVSTKNDAPLHSYGIVCNTDSSRGGGQHWFAIFISTDGRDEYGKPKITIELFNSAGGGVNNQQFNDFWQTMALNIARETGLCCEYKIVSSLKHQSDSTGNCGSYSLFYIYARLQGAKSDEFNNPHKKITDNRMRDFRQVCFKLETDENSLSF